MERSILDMLTGANYEHTESIRSPQKSNQDSLISIFNQKFSSDQSTDSFAKPAIPNTSSLFNFVSPFIAAKSSQENKSFGIPLNRDTLVLPTSSRPMISTEETDPETVTIVPNATEYRPGCIIVADKTFIIYAVRAGKIRVIHKKTGAHILIKGYHTQNIVDMTIQNQQNTSRLLTAAQDQSFLLLDIRLDKIQITFKVLLHIKGGEDMNSPYSRVLWDPVRPDCFAMSCYQKLYVVETCQTESTSTYESISQFENANGVVCTEAKENISALCFSIDSTVIASATMNGQVTLWSLKDAYPKTIKQITISQDALVIDSIHFVGTHDNTLYSGNSLLFITVNQNKTLKLFDMINESLIHEIQIEQVEYANISFDSKLDTVSISLNLEDNPQLVHIHVKKPSMNPSMTLESPKSSADLLLDPIHLFDYQNCCFDFVCSSGIKEKVIGFSSFCDDTLTNTSRSFYCVHAKEIDGYTLKAEQIYPQDQRVNVLNEQSALEIQNMDQLQYKNTLIKQNESQTRLLTGDDNPLIQLLMKNTAVQESDSREPSVVGYPSQIVANRQGSPLPLPNSNIDALISSFPKKEKESSKRSSNSTPKKVNLEIIPEPSKKKADTNESPDYKKKSETKKSESDHSKKFNNKSDGESVKKTSEKRDSDLIELTPGMQKVIQTTIEKSMEKQTERIISEILPKLLSKSSALDPIAAAITKNIQPNLEASLLNLIQNEFVPGIQRSVREMLSQVHKSLEQGIASLVQSHSNSKQQNDILTQLIESTRKLEIISNQFELNKSMHSQTESIEKMSESLRQTISQEFKKLIESERMYRNDSFNRLESAVASPGSAFFPETQFDLKSDIQNHIQDGDLESAFTKALGSNDLSLVLVMIIVLVDEYICTRVKIALVFGKGTSILSQPEESLLHLDSKNSVIEFHIPQVLRLVNKRLEDLLKSVENYEIHRKIQIVQMIVNGVLV